MTFNIRHGVDKDGKESLHAIIEEVKDAGAKIIALQEVDRLMPRSGFKDQAKEIAEALGYHYVYGETINLLGVKYGNALISHYPIIEYENKKLPNDRLETRGLLKAENEGNEFMTGTCYSKPEILPNGKLRIYIVNSHGDTCFPSAKRT